MPTVEEVQTWQGQDAYGPDEQKIGEIADIYLDRDTGRPEWAAVKTGMFGSKLSFAPLADAHADGDHVDLPYDKAKVKDAPKVDADGELSPEEEAGLYRYYGLEYSEAPSDSAMPAGRDDTAGHDVSGPESDDAMTRSEEELAVGTQRVETGRVRLKKYVVTEQVQKTVPIEREEIRVEREPITDGNADAAHAGPAISEDEHEVTLHTEKPVVEKTVVPKERVRLDKDTVTEQEQVSQQVRKEQIEADGDTRR